MLDRNFGINPLIGSILHAILPHCGRNFKYLATTVQRSGRWMNRENTVSRVLTYLNGNLSLQSIFQSLHNFFAFLATGWNGMLCIIAKHGPVKRGDLNSFFGSMNHIYECRVNWFDSKMLLKGHSIRNSFYKLTITLILSKNYWCWNCGQEKYFEKQDAGKHPEKHWNYTQVQYYYFFL